MQSFFQIVADNNDFLHFTPREFYAASDKVFVLGDYAMTLKKTGKKYESDWIHVFTFKDGKFRTSANSWTPRSPRKPIGAEA